jgi:hypothetical protein
VSVLLALALGVVASTIFALGERAARQKAAEEALRATQSEQDAQRANTHTIAALNDLRQAQAETKEALAQSEESRKQAEAAEKKARAEANKAQAINDFLTEDLLTQAEPAHTAAEDHVTLLEVLDRAATKVGDRFARQPEVEEALRRTIARTYHSLGSWEKAERQWRAVLEAARRRLGGDSAPALLAAGELAHILGHRGRLDTEVLELARSAAEGLARALGPDHRETLNSRSNLAIAYKNAGRKIEAIALHEGTLKLQESKLGPDHPDTLSSRNNLATAYSEAGCTSEAIELYETTLKLRESKLGPNHPDTLSSRNNLAATYSEAGRTIEAIALYETTLKLRESKLGPDHPQTLHSRNDLAAAYWRVGRLDRSVPLFEDTLKVQESKLGPDHPHTLITLANLGTNYCDAGRLEEGIGLMEQALVRARTRYGSIPPSLEFTETQLAVAYVRARRFDKAEPLYRNALERARQRYGPADPRTAAAMAPLGSSLIQQRKWPEAETILRECLAIREKAMPDDRLRFNTMSQLGGALLGQGRHAEAEPLIVSGYEGMKAREDRIPSASKIRLREASERLVRLYEAWGKPDQATAWKAKLGLNDLPADVFAQP